MPPASLDRHSPFPASAPTRADAKAMDSRDPLAGARDQFHIPHGLIYLDGNSLGVLPRGTANRVFDTVRAQWGEDLIAGWTKDGWDGPASTASATRSPRWWVRHRVLIVACDTTSLNLYKLLAAALAERPERRTVVSERSNFPTDLYVAEGLFRTLGQGHRLRSRRFRR